MNDGQTLYDRAGGQPFFEALTRRFYQAVAEDPLLRPLYPESREGLEAARHHLELFLIQYWGGPSTYNQARGQPRLRLRHAPFSIGPAERDAWMRHMTDAVRGGGLSRLDEMQLLSYLSSAASALVNQPGPLAGPVGW